MAFSTWRSDFAEPWRVIEDASDLGHRAKRDEETSGDLCAKYRHLLARDMSDENTTALLTLCLHDVRPRDEQSIITKGEPSASLTIEEQLSNTGIFLPIPICH